MFTALIRLVEESAASSDVLLPAGADAQQLSAAERALGVTLPAEMHAFYLAHDGGGEARRCRGHRLLSIEQIVHEWTKMKAQFDAGEFEGDGADDGAEAVRQEIWIPSWIPVTTDDEDNWLMVDLAPGEEGTSGQIIGVWESGPRLVEGTSFLAWLSQVAWYDAAIAPGAGEDGNED
ncbi:MAG: SMI1/KNR4 family protein [Myxococcales bacterium]|nr:SMI1/KNR4 family protein [Myxococcales bacterium]